MERKDERQEKNECEGGETHWQLGGFLKVIEALVYVVMVGPD